MNYYLVIGGSAVSGEQTISAIRSEDKDAYIISTSSKEGDVQNADETFRNIDLRSEESISRISEGLKDRHLKSLIYIPARGMVGKPVQYADKAEYLDSLNFSVIPMLKLTKVLKPGLSVWFSGFMWLKPLMLFYGTMTYTKITMEQITLQFPKQFKCIRYGMFHSDSVRGISVLVQKSLNSNLYPEMNEYKEAWKKSGKKFKEFFPGMNYEFEESQLKTESSFDKPFRPLEPKDIQIGIKKALFYNTKPILNVVGDWYWENDSLPVWPAEIQKHMDIISADLDKYLK
ncbi:MAG TPA: hypothetical protein PL048_12745 [Leptospiraceae bacterium]|nr:hypothetical protein [Leptospiraceae bacterium]HMY67021.1 hypothetical protein [Leptospiraceae bacterium]HMZ59641.1 hypothetical protein [Leptospiraceae bacterium]HNF15202.1 hypothetical protein [Leptospiraceae bacterium]HNF23738.1 hypothetical protein [Leptospiraceae bacterium]